MDDAPSQDEFVYRLAKTIERLRTERENVRQYIIRNILQPHGVTRFHDDLLGVCDQADHISATAFLEGVKAGLEAAKEELLSKAEAAPGLLQSPSLIWLQAAGAVTSLDPATITRRGGADG